MYKKCEYDKDKHGYFSHGWIAKMQCEHMNDCSDSNGQANDKIKPER